VEEVWVVLDQFNWSHLLGQLLISLLDGVWVGVFVMTVMIALVTVTHIYYLIIILKVNKFL